MSSRGRRTVLATTAGTLGIWGVVWAVGAAAGWHPAPLLILATTTLAAVLWRLLAAVGSTTATLPRVHVRVVPSSPVGEDPRLLRHQLQLDDATGDPPSCRPVLTRISELAVERLRLADPSDPREPAARADVLGPRLAALLDQRPPDRTQLSPRELTRLVDDLEALRVGPSAAAVHLREDPAAP
ncbi:MAG TPA: hypothetical protein VFL94_10070 [Actinomycetales bacterium]|nr:hypothetical protein [Actinomycetales bacterium]